jgi:hypothetical protein
LRRSKLSAIKGSSAPEEEERYRGKVFPIHAINKYRGAGGTPPLILDLGSTWK